jgi:hypothetical protein
MYWEEVLDLENPNLPAEVGKSNEFIALLYSVDFFKTNKGLILIITFYFN